MGYHTSSGFSIGGSSESVLTGMVKLPLSSFVNVMSMVFISGLRYVLFIMCVLLLYYCLPTIVYIYARGTGLALKPHAAKGVPTVNCAL